jgi:hypothetical protein
LTDFHSAVEPTQPSKRIGVLAPAATPGLEPLLDALQRIFPVRFERVDASPMRSVDAALVLDPARLADAPAGIPRLVLARAESAGAAGKARRGTPAAVALAEDERLPRPLRGRTIAEEALCAELPHQPAVGDDATTHPPLAAGGVLASVDRRPVWWQDAESAASLAFSAYPIAQLRAGEALREHLCAGRFMGLLPLVHFLGGVLGAEGWTPSPLRASFVIDDPNLHWPSYGYLGYRELLAHATRHGYHVGFATIPLDGWLVNRRSAALVRENPAALSLLIHGNDHVARELGRLRTDAGAEPAIAQALRRIARLERRTGIAIERVMAPPHGACSEAALRAMFRLGIEAACISRPYPWRDGLPAPTPLAGWYPAELVAGGLPVLPRYPLGHPREDLALRALLGQPLILYGHHGDFVDGLDLFAQAAAAVNGLGDAQWGPLGWIARRNYATRRVGETLYLDMYARRIALEVPVGVQTLCVRLREPFGGSAWHRLAVAAEGSVTGGSAGVTFSDGVGLLEPQPVAAPTGMELTLVADRPLDAELLAAPGSRPWPAMRRVLVEGRDRFQPLLRMRRRV